MNLFNMFFTFTRLNIEENHEMNEIILKQNQDQIIVTAQS